jgi:ubiquinone/menaquinone biosynthesis C-methylase UbiE
VKIWDIKARLYVTVRRLWPLRLIQDKENTNVVAMLSDLCRQNALILDIGCGSGNVFRLLPKSIHIIGLDSSWEMLRRIGHHHNVAVVQGDATCLPFKRNCTDLLLSIGVMEYQPNMTSFLKELSSIAKLRGYLVLTSTPPGIFTMLRRLQFIPLQSILAGQVIEEAHKQGLILVEHRHSLMQDQYLFQKKR